MTASVADPRVVVFCVHLRDLSVRGWLQDFDIEAADGRGTVKLTPVRAHAKVFPEARAALEAWNAIPRARPTRPDGMPNRPLSAFTFEIMGVDAASMLATYQHGGGNP
jgi:hypothetical protein